jgi:CBS domain-containing protein
MSSVPATAGELMTQDVVTLDENQGIDHLEEAFKLCRFRHMPVVDEGRLIGLVTLKDVLRVSASSLSPSKTQQDQFLFSRFKVRDIMATELVTVHADTPLSKVADLMQGKKIGCIPVVEGENSLVGIITEADFVRLGGELLRKLAT